MTTPAEGAALATVTELQDRLDWTLSTDESRLAASTLDDLSEHARFYGSSTWTSDVTAPRMAKTIVLQAAARFMRNPDGYTQSRAGDETVAWSDTGQSASAGFTAPEIKLLRELAGGSTGLVSVLATAWGPVRRHCNSGEGRVPSGYGKSFPLYDSDTSPW